MIQIIACLVIAITDGDTLKVRCDEQGNFQQHTIRLAEIDAPEKSQPYGERSKQNLSKLCYLKVAQIKQQSIDRYGRKVAFVNCDGKNANFEQVKNGFAWVYDKYAKDRSLYEVQNQARDQKLGLWLDPDPIQPWLFRKAKKKAIE